MAIRDAWGGQDLTVVAFHPEALPWPDGVAPEPLRVSETTTWSYALSYVPHEPVTGTSSLWVAVIQPDGSLVPVGG